MPNFTQGLTQGDFLNKCDVMAAGAKANADVPGVQDLIFPFEAAIQGARSAQSERALQRAQAQQTSRNLDEHLTTASDIYSKLRRLFLAWFGPKAEKLAELGLQPLRPAQKAKPNPQSPEQKPPEQGQKPTQAATPATGEVN
jgi:hypothetical protein